MKINPKKYRYYSVFFLFLFAVITLLIVTKNSWIFSLDLPSHQFLLPIVLPFQIISQWISWTFDSHTFILWFPFVGLWLYFQKYLKFGLFLLIGNIGMHLLFVGLSKILIGRPRSDFALIEVHDGSFPSGHTYAAVFFGMAMIYFLAPKISGKIRGIFVGLMASIIILVPLSRLGLLVHYPTDIIAGIVLALGIFYGMWSRFETCIYLDKFTDYLYKELGRFKFLRV